MKIDEHRTKEIFTALSLHFRKDSYDYIKYNGKLSGITCKASEFWFISIARRLQEEDKIRNFYLSNIIDTYIRENKIETFGKNFNERSNHIVYEKWAKLDLIKQFYNIINSYDDIREMIKVEDSNYPKLYSEYICGNISMEFIILLKEIMPNLYDYWKAGVDDDILFPDFIKVCIKYGPFLTVDKKQLKTIVMQHLNNKNN